VRRFSRQPLPGNARVGYGAPVSVRPVRGARHAGSAASAGVPPARIDNPTPGERARLAGAKVVRHWRKVVLVVAVLAFLDWRYTHIFLDQYGAKYEAAKKTDTPKAWREYASNTGDRSRARSELRRHHEATRKGLRERGASRPDGFDPLLAVLLQEVDDRVELQAERLDVDTGSFAAITPVPGAEMVGVSAQLRGALDGCDDGFSAAFENATGTKAIVVIDPSADLYSESKEPPASISMTWTARANGQIYVGHDQHAFPGFGVEAKVKLAAGDTVLATVEAIVDPGERFEYTSKRFVGMLGTDDRSVIVGMVKASCQRLGERLVEQMTGSMATAPAAEDPKDAEDHCYSGGLIARGACVVAAEQALATGGKAAIPRATFLLDLGCEANDPEACIQSAELGHEDREALLKRLRGCDLGGGDPEICSAARRAALSLAKLGKRDRVFAVRWGMWFEHTPTAITWVATSDSTDAVRSRLRKLVAEGRARVYSPDELPTGVIGPDGAGTIYALHGPDMPQSRGAQRCTECDGDDRYGLRGGCKCLPAGTVDARP